MSTKTDELLQELLDTQGPLGNARLAKYHESAIQTDATAAIVVRPDTVAALTAWNGEPIGGKSLVIDRIFTHNLVSTAVKSFGGLWYCIHKGDMTAPTNDITTLRGTGDGRLPNTTTVLVDAGATVVDDGWFPCGESVPISETGVTPQGIAQWECNGRLVVPPRAAISIQVVSSLVGETYTSGLSWWRIEV